MKWQVATEPTQLDIKNTVDNINLYAGTTVTVDGKKIKPVTNPLIAQDKLITSNSGLPFSSMGVSENFMYLKPQASETHYLYNKQTGEFTTISTSGNQLFRDINFSYGLQPYQLMGRLNSNDGMIEHNGILYTCGVYSGGSNSWLLRIDTSKISGLSMSLNLNSDLINIPNYTTVPPHVYKTRKYILFLRNATYGQRFNTNAPYDTVTNPLVQWTVPAGQVIGTQHIVTVHRIFDAMETDQDIMTIIGTCGPTVSTASSGFVAKFNIVTRTIISYSLMSISWASIFENAPVYEDEKIQIVTGTNYVFLLNKITLSVSALYARYNHLYSRKVNVTSEYIDLEVVPTYINQIANQTTEFIRLRRERIYFDGRVSEPLPNALIPINILTGVSGLSAPYYAPTYFGDIYLSTYGGGTDYMGIYTATENEAITSYKVVIE